MPQGYIKHNFSIMTKYSFFEMKLQRSLRDIAELYKCEPSLDKVEDHRKSEGLASISSKCFGAANISAVFIDDGIMFDKMLDWQSHKSFVSAVGRILRIEHLAETILNEVSNPPLY